MRKYDDGRLVGVKSTSIETSPEPPSSGEAREELTLVTRLSLWFNTNLGPYYGKTSFLQHTAVVKT